MVGADRSGRATASSASRPSARGRLGDAALADIGDPVDAAPRHRRHGRAADDEDAIVAPGILVDGAGSAAGSRRRRSPPAAGSVGRIAEEAQAAPLGAEQGLEHEALARAAACSISEARAASRCSTDPGRRCRQAGPGQQEAGRGLVDAAFDGAGRVDHGDAHGLERMQHPQPQRHLLEAAGRDRADQDDPRQPGKRAQPYLARADGEAAVGEVDPFDATGQALAARAAGAGHASPRHGRRAWRRQAAPSPNDCSSRSGASLPAAKVRPESRQVTNTRAGLNSIGSIL